MYARLTILDDVDPRLEEETWRWVTTEGRRLQQQLPGFEGVMTLVDAEGRRVVRIHLHDNEAHAREADAILDDEQPEGFPDELRRRAENRTYTGLFEVVERDGI